MTPFEYDESEFEELDYFDSLEELEDPLCELPDDEGFRGAVLNLLAIIGLQSEEVAQLDEDSTEEGAPSCTLLLEAWDYDQVFALYAVPDAALTKAMSDAVAGCDGEFFNFGDCVGNNLTIMPHVLRVLSATGYLDSPERLLKAIVKDFSYPEPDCLPSVDDLNAVRNQFEPFLVGTIEGGDDSWKLEKPELLNVAFSSFSMYRRMDDW